MGADRAQVRDLVVYDGQTAVGFVRSYGSTHVAYDTGGNLVGRFASQQAAVRAIPSKTAPARNGRGRAGRGSI